MGLLIESQAPNYSRRLRNAFLLRSLQIVFEKVTYQHPLFSVFLIINIADENQLADLDCPLLVKIQK